MSNENVKITAQSILFEHGIELMRMQDDFNTQLLNSMERYAESYSDQQTLQLQSRIKELEDERKWISVGDMLLPEIGQRVLAFRPLAPESGDELITDCTYTGILNISPQGVEHKFDRWAHPTHWMPLPQPPLNQQQ